MSLVEDNGTERCCCTLGSALVALVGWDQACILDESDSDAAYEALEEEWPELCSLHDEWPGRRRAETKKLQLLDIVSVLNDSEKWERQAIARWLAGKGY